MTKEETKKGAARALLILLFMGIVGFALGLSLGWETSGEEEAFYRGMYSACVISSLDEVNCLNLQNAAKTKTHTWEWDLWQWPLPEVTPTPTRNLQEQQRG